MGCNRNKFDSSTRSKRNLYQYYKTRTTQTHFRASKIIPSTTACLPAGRSGNKQVPLHGQTVKGSYSTNGRTFELLKELLRKICSSLLPQEKRNGQVINDFHKEICIALYDCQA